MSIPSWIAGIVAVVGFAVPTYAADQTVTLANGDWAPYQGEDLAGGGPATRIATEAFESQGWSVTFRYLPWARGKKLAARGDLDGTMIYSYTEERDKEFAYSEPVITLRDVIFYKKNNPIDWSQPSDLSGLTFGGVVDYDYDLLRENPDLDVDMQRVAKPELNFRKLAAGRVDAIISNELVGKSLARKAGVMDKLNTHPKAASSEPYHLMVSEAVDNTDAIVAAFNAGLAALKKSGRYQEILDSVGRSGASGS